LGFINSNYYYLRGKTGILIHSFNFFLITSKNIPFVGDVSSKGIDGSLAIQIRKGFKHQGAELKMELVLF